MGAGLERMPIPSVGKAGHPQESPDKPEDRLLAGDDRPGRRPSGGEVGHGLLARCADPGSPVPPFHPGKAGTRFQAGVPATGNGRWSLGPVPAAGFAGCSWLSRCGLVQGRNGVSRASTRCTTAAERNCPTGAMTRESRGSSKQGDPSGTGGDS